MNCNHNYKFKYYCGNDFCECSKCGNVISTKEYFEQLKNIVPHNFKPPTKINPK